MAFDKDRQKWLLTQEMTDNVMEELVNLNQGLIHLQLKKFYMLNDDDAYSIALEALFKAIRTFDVTKGFEFSTYANVVVYNRLGSYLRNNKSGFETISYDVMVNNGDSFLSMMKSDNTVDGKNTYIDRQAVMLIYSIVYKEINRLEKKPTYKLILFAWLDSGFKANQEEIASVVGYTQSYVSRVLKWFRQHIKNKLLEG